MANQAFLIKTSKEKSEELFEANNTIPLFWLTLLDADIIKKFGQKIIDHYNNYYNNDNNSEDDEREAEGVNIKIPKQTFLKNANEGKRFIEENYKDKISLFNDFVKYLNDKFDETDILELNITEIGNFNGIENLVNDIKNITANIKRNVNKIRPFEPDSTIFSFVGYDDFFANDFRNYSKDYLEYCLNEEKERELRNKKLAKQQSKEKRKEKFKNIFMCVGGIACIAISILTIISGSYFLGIVVLLFGGIALLFGVLNLKG